MENLNGSGGFEHVLKRENRRLSSGPKKKKKKSN